MARDRLKVLDVEVTAVVNVGDDIWLHGLRICPDLDTVMYTLGDGIDPERGWGRRDETWSTKEELAAKAGKVPWCVPGKLHLARFALDIGAFALDYFERYYGLPYPGDKLDMLAIPDFAAGAMENLGAITYRETALLVDEAAASHAERERVADVVAHEIAHMWFGDLVTMAWWDNLWLNEGFASWMGTKCTEKFNPQWETWLSKSVPRDPTRRYGIGKESAHHQSMRTPPVTLIFSLASTVNF